MRFAFFLLRRQIFKSSILKSKLGKSINVFHKVEGNIVQQMSYYDFKTYLPEDILTKVDRASMSESLEVRVPLCDHKVVELSFGLGSMAGNDYIGKKLPKRYVKKNIPIYDLGKKKSGFNFPIRILLRDKLKIWAKNLLSNSLLLKNITF